MSLDEGAMRGSVPGDGPITEEWCATWMHRGHEGVASYCVWNGQSDGPIVEVFFSGQTRVSVVGEDDDETIHIVRARNTKTRRQLLALCEGFGIEVEE